jgi:20S proteasome alpha/beta subunit
MAITSVPHRLPKPRQKPYIHPKAKAMTIVVGFQCSDGVVIAADRLLSAEGSHKFQEEKLLPIECLNSTFYLAYSGSPVLAKEAREKLLHRLDAIDSDFLGRKPITRQQAQECIETTLVEMAQQRFDRLSLSLLIVAIYPNASPDLWIFSDNGFHTVFDFEVIGVGDSSLIRYLQQLYHTSDTVSYCERLAIFLIEKAKAHIDGCGGQTDLVTIATNSKGRWEATKLSEEAITELAAKMARRERGILREIIED